MPKAPRQCPAPGCDQLIRHTRYCPQHTKLNAFTSPDRPYGAPSRTSTPQWRKIAAQARTRDHNRCTQCGADGRTTPLECDHITNAAAGGTDSLDNAQMLCISCHQRKTQAEAHAGRRMHNS